MVRLIALVALAAIAAAAIFVVVGALASATRDIDKAGSALAGRDGMRNVIYGALFVLLLGVTSGLLGGL